MDTTNTKLTLKQLKERKLAEALKENLLRRKIKNNSGKKNEKPQGMD